MKLGYYPGCALEGSSYEYAKAVERVLREIGVELVQIEDWNCCGASAAHSTNHKLAVALPYRNLATARAQGLTEIFAPCPFCSKTHITTNHEITENPALKSEMRSATGLDYDGSLKIINSVAVFDMFMDKLVSKINPERLRGLKVACYYGCLLVRPPKLLKYDNPEQPVMMDQVVAKLGAQPVDWEYKVECCGGGFTICDEPAVLELSRKILEDARDNGARAIIVACQMCQVNLDMRQKNIEKRYNTRFNMPIIYLPQLIGLAMGINPKELGLDVHFVPTEPILK
ncbi:MAG: CoB--CoM heterodisulfide reductase iron-sulfur subunit B family protein [Candidatus Brocadiia bacterium]